MDIQRIITDLKQERERLDRAISILEGLGSGRRRGRPAGGHAVAKHARRHMTAASRKRISQMMKQRWAERSGKKRREDDWGGPLLKS